MFLLPNAEFYITNVCNFTCENCNRFNHMNFKGNYKWQKNLYEKWAKLVDIKQIAILGGEPTLNPDLPNFILGISKLWPKASKEIVTNGTNLKSALVHELCKRYNWNIHICLHNKPGSRINKYIINNLAKHYGPFKNLTRKQTKQKSLTEQNHAFSTETFLHTKYGVQIKISEMTEFHENAFKDEKNLTLYESDPVQAYKYCTMKTCHHFFDGKLYKCGVVKLVPDIMKQKGKAYPKIYDQYVPLDPNDLDQQKLDDLVSNPIAQCKHCPANKEDWTLRSMQSGMLGNKLKNL